MKMCLISLLLVVISATPALAQQVVIQLDSGNGGQSVSLSSQGMGIIFGGNSMYRRRISMKAPGSITVGSSVITDRDQTGNVVGINPAAQEVNVAIPYYGTSSFSLSQLGATDGCNGVFCVGETVVTPNNQEGTVAGLFGDGTVAVSIPYYGTSNFKATSVGLTDACSGQFCTGDTVITDRQQSGTVQAIFADGSIAVSVPYYGTSTYQVAQLSLTKAICANIYIDRIGLCR